VQSLADWVLNPYVLYLFFQSCSNSFDREKSTTSGWIVEEEAVLVQFEKALHESILPGYFSWCVPILLEWKSRNPRYTLFSSSSGCDWLALVIYPCLVYFVLGFCRIEWFMCRKWGVHVKKGWKELRCRDWKLCHVILNFDFFLFKINYLLAGVKIRRITSHKLLQS